jgi:DNA polymerase
VSRKPAGFPPAEAFFPPRRTLPALARAVQDCRGCPLYRNATQAVFGEGKRDARLVMVGEQPGDQEDLQGHVFVGAAGKMLDRCLAEVGLPRQELWLTNAVKHFKFEPRGKRRIHKKPTTTEVQACFPWLEAELERLAPEMVVCLGATAIRAVLGPKVAVTRDHGKVFSTEWAPWVMPTYHPSALLRAPDEQRDATRETFLADLRIAAQHYFQAARSREVAPSTGTKRDLQTTPGGDHGTRHGTRGAR